MKNLLFVLLLTCINVASLYSQPCDPSVSKITESGNTTFCEGGVVLLTSTTGGGIWYKNGVMISPIPSSDYRAMAIGYYNVIVEFGHNCKSDTNGTGVVVTVTPRPKSDITTGGNTTFCDGGSVMLSSSSATGNQWYKNGQPIGEGGQSYIATASGVYNIIYYISAGCESDSTGESVVVNVQVKPITNILSTYTVICKGYADTLKSSVPVGNQWYKNGALIPGANSKDLVVNSQGNYNLIVTNGLCTSDTTGKGTFVFVRIPPKPSITQIGDSLISSDAIQYQWNLEGRPIKDATKKSLYIKSIGNYSVTIQDYEGCSDTSDIFKAIPTEVLFPEQTKLILYPNPVSDLLTISSTQVFYLKIFDQVSKKVIEAKINEGETSIDLAELNPGIYFLILQNVNNFYSHKIEKK